MVASRSPVFLMAILCIGTLLSQLAFVKCSPQFQMRPNLHVYGADISETTPSSSVASTATTELLLESTSPATITDASVTQTTEAATVTSFPDTESTSGSQASSSASNKYTSSLTMTVLFGLGLAVLQAS